MKRTTKHVFAVLRFDGFLVGSVTPTKVVTVKEVLLTKEQAESEVQRLNTINQGKNCVYFWQMTRLVERA